VTGSTEGEVLRGTIPTSEQSRHSEGLSPPLPGPSLEVLPIGTWHHPTLHPRHLRASPSPSPQCEPHHCLSCNKSWSGKTEGMQEGRETLTSQPQTDAASPYVYTCSAAQRHGQ